VWADWVETVAACSAAPLLRAACSAHPLLRTLLLTLVLALIEGL